MCRLHFRLKSCVPGVAPLINHVMSKSPIAAKLIPVLAVCLLAQGCVGVVFPHTKTRTFKNPQVGDHPAIHAVYEGTGRTNNFAASWLQEHWGKPANIRLALTQAQGEVWTYKFGLAWYGVVPCVIVPVPLALPLGRQKVEFLMRDGRVVSADVIQLGFSGAAAGLLGPDGGSWSFSEW